MRIRLWRPLFDGIPQYGTAQSHLHTLQRSHDCAMMWRRLKRKRLSRRDCWWWSCRELLERSNSRIDRLETECYLLRNTSRLEMLIAFSVLREGAMHPLLFAWLACGGGLEAIKVSLDRARGRSRIGIWGGSVGMVGERFGEGPWCVDRLQVEPAILPDTNRKPGELNSHSFKEYKVQTPFVGRGIASCTSSVISIDCSAGDVCCH